MTDHDEKLTRRYRELAREEPDAALDAAILAASRRGVARPSATRQWAMPVSIAAVLVLAVGVTLRMQHEQPGIETATPMSEYSSPAAAPEAAVRVEAPQPSPKAEGEQRAAAKGGIKQQQAKEKLAARDDAKPRALDRFQAAPELMKKDAQAKAEPKAFADAPAPAAAPAFAGAAAPAPAPMQPQAAAPSMLQVPSPKAEGEQPMPPQAEADAYAPRAKREAAANMTRSPPITGRTQEERELERIARLRAEARHAEADKALEEFRRRNPQYRIPEAMWERVRPR